MKRRNRPSKSASPPSGTGEGRVVAGKARRVFNRAAPFLLVAVVLLGFGLRAADLKADPPPDLSWSTAHYSDEGLNNYSARNMALYGTWRTDDFLPYVVYPLTNMLVALVFRLFGIGFVQVKLIALLCGVLGVWVMYLLVRREAGRKAALVAALGLATCYPLVMYSRLGLVETMQILFLLLTGFFFSRGLEKPANMLLSGLFAAGTVLFVKVSAVFIIPVMVALFAWQLLEARGKPAGTRPLRRGIGYWFAGVGVTAIAWFFLVFLPYRADYLDYVLRHSLESPAGHPESPAGYLVNLFTVGATSGVGSDPLVFFLDTFTPRAWFRLLAKLPVVAFVGYLFLPRLLRKPGLRYLLLWFGFGLLMLGWMNYRPPRYEIVLLPVMVASFALVVARLFESPVIKPMAKPSLWRAGVAALWLWPLMFQLAMYSGVFIEQVAVGFDTALLLITLAAAVAASAVGYAFVRLCRREILIRPLWPRVGVAVALLLAMLWSDATRFNEWYRYRDHVLVEYSDHLDWILPEGSVLAGSWAPTLLMNSRKKALVLIDWANSEDPLNRYRVTHLITREDGYGVRLFDQLYPEVMIGASIVQSYLVRGFILTVYELPPVPR